MEILGVNWLSVYQLGDYCFGKPSRITASTSMGKSGIINIEREASLSGPTHNKGALEYWRTGARPGTKRLEYTAV